MGTFNNATPRQLVLDTWEREARKIAVAGTTTAAPADFYPLTAPQGSAYTHVGHSAQYGNGRRWGFSVRLLIVHTTETDAFLGGMSYSARRDGQVGCTAFAGSQANEIGYSTPEHNRPWTTGRWNDESLSLEICGKSAWTEAQWRARPGQIENIITILVDWCQRYDIPPVWLTPDEVAEGAGRTGVYPAKMGTRRGITDHWNANLAARSLGSSYSSTTHSDIGAGLRAVLFTTIIPEVQRRLNADVQPPIDPPNPPTPGEPRTMQKPAGGPFRNSDTRKFGVPLKAGKVYTFGIDGSKVPFGSECILANITIVRPTRNGHIVVWGENDPKPGVSSVNWEYEDDALPDVEEISHNNVLIWGTEDGKFNLEISHGEAHVIVDIFGYQKA